jgi:hypothetical protein
MYSLCSYCSTESTGRGSTNRGVNDQPEATVLHPAPGMQALADFIVALETFTIVKNRHTPTLWECMHYNTSAKSTSCSQHSLRAVSLHCVAGLQRGSLTHTPPPQRHLTPCYRVPSDCRTVPHVHTHTHTQPLQHAHNCSMPTTATLAPHLLNSPVGTVVCSAGCTATPRLISCVHSHTTTSAAEVHLVKSCSEATSVHL